MTDAASSPTNPVLVRRTYLPGATPSPSFSTRLARSSEFATGDQTTRAYLPRPRAARAASHLLLPARLAGAPGSACVQQSQQSPHAAIFSPKWAANRWCRQAEPLAKRYIWRTCDLMRVAISLGASCARRS
jgi:hypothetical protein